MLRAALALMMVGMAHGQIECHDMVKGAIDRCTADCSACHLTTVRPSRLAPALFRSSDVVEGARASNGTDLALLDPALALSLLPHAAALPY